MLFMVQLTNFSNENIFIELVNQKLFKQKITIFYVLDKETAP